MNKQNPCFYQRMYYSKLIQTIRRIIQQGLGDDFFEKIRKKIAPAHKSLMQTGNIKNSSEEITGVNIIGCFSTENGLGEAARSVATAIRRIGMRVALKNITHDLARKEDKRFASMYAKNLPFKINILILDMDNLLRYYYGGGLMGQYNIAFLNWELDKFPSKWANALNLVDEIWVPSSFTADALSKVAMCPVVKIPYCINKQDSSDFGRAHFEIPDKKFVFLFVFDFLSIVERKNPVGAILAFKKAFKKSSNAMLVIKCTNHSKFFREYTEILSESKGYPIKIINRYLSRAELDSLFNLCDCYVSLHRAEGFGLTMAEAMYLGKPVIATGYSSNMDFMNVNNSFLVKYHLIKLQEDCGPYSKGDVWAESDVNHAAELMRFVFENKKEAKKIGEIAARDIRLHLDPNKMGAMIKQRLNRINHQLMK